MVVSHNSLTNYLYTVIYTIYISYMCAYHRNLRTICYIIVLQEVAKDEANKQPSTEMGKQVETLDKQLADLKLEEQLGVELIGSLTDPQGAQFK